MQNKSFLPFKAVITLFVLGLLALGAFSLSAHGNELLSLKVLYGYNSRVALVKGAASYISIQDLYKKTLLKTYDPDPGWFKYTPSLASSEDLQIDGDSGLLVDLDSGNILFEKNASKKKKIASVTKIMTAVIALEHANLDKQIRVSENAASIGENTMGILPGETYTLEELLYGLLLPSGNDAAYAIAEGIGGNVETFVAWMNMKASELGLYDTYFADPSGLDDTTYSTAVDLLILSKYALKHQDFRNVVKTYEKELASDTHQALFLTNQTNLLTTYPGVQGIKTGYTEEAGLCLVTYALLNGKEVVGVVLDSTDRKGDMILMLDYGFNKLGEFPEHDLLN